VARVGVLFRPAHGFAKRVKKFTFNCFFRRDLLRLVVFKKKSLLFEFSLQLPFYMLRREKRSCEDARSGDGGCDISDERPAHHLRTCTPPAHLRTTCAPDQCFLL
jgi:hypothetical protein